MSSDFTAQPDSLGVAVKIVVEIVAARLLRPHIDDGLGADRDDFLEMQFAAFEFGDDRIEILDMDGDAAARRRVQFGGIEFMILHGDRQRDRIVGARTDRAEAQRSRRARKTPTADSRSCRDDRIGKARFLCRETLPKQLGK